MPEKTYGVCISDFNVPNNGQKDAYAGIQKALDSGAPLVYIPFGTYWLTRGLKISSHTRLEVHPEAKLVFADGAGKNVNDFLLSNANPEAGDSSIQVNGGIWDGNNRKNPRGEEGRMDSYTGTLINMNNVSGLCLANMLLKDSTAYFTRFTHVKNFRIENIEFQITHMTRNQDGIHCAGFCENGEIHNIEAHGRMNTGDDLVALNADDALLRSELLGADAGYISNLRISNLKADDCHAFVRLASIWHKISDIDIRGIQGGCRQRLINADALRYCMVPLFDVEDPRYKEGVGLLQNIRLADALVHKTNDNDAALITLESRMDNFELANVQRDISRDAVPDIPILIMRNVNQNLITAEYKAVGECLNQAGHVQNCDEYRLAGRDDFRRFERKGKGDEFILGNTSHILNTRISEPILKELPPANNMIGMS